MGLTHADVALAMQGMDSLQKSLIQRQMMQRQEKEDAEKQALNQQLLGLRQTEAGNLSKRYDQASKHEDRMYQQEQDRTAMMKQKADADAAQKAQELKQKRISGLMTWLKDGVAKGVIPAAQANASMQNALKQANPDDLAGTELENFQGFQDPAKKEVDMIDEEITTEDPVTHEKRVVKHRVPASSYTPTPKPPEEGSIEAETAAAQKGLIAAQISGDPKALKLATEKLARIHSIKKEAVFNPLTGKMEIPGMDSAQATPGTKKTAAPLPGASETIDLPGGGTYKTAAINSWQEHPDAPGLQNAITQQDALIARLGSAAPETKKAPAFGMYGAGGVGVTYPTSMSEKMQHDASVKAAIAKRMQLQQQLDALKQQYPEQVPAPTPAPWPKQDWE